MHEIGTGGYGYGYHCRNHQPITVFTYNRRDKTVFFNGCQRITDTPNFLTERMPANASRYTTRRYVRHRSFPAVASRNYNFTPTFFIADLVNPLRYFAVFVINSYSAN